MSESVAVLVPNLGGGGAERAMLAFASELARRSYRVDLIGIRAKGHLRKLVPAGVRVVDLAAPRAARAIGKLVRYLREENPRVLFATQAHANLLAVIARALARVPVTVVLRETSSPLSEIKSSLRRRMVHRLVPVLYPMAHHIIAGSRRGAEELVQMQPSLRDKVSVLPNPVVTAEMLEQAEQRLDDPWFEQGQPPVVLGVGRLVKLKGFETLVEAFAELRKERPARLVILGEGPERETLLSLAARLGVAEDLRLPGFVLNPFAYMRRAGVLALASRYEGMPNVLIQALALGVPVVSTNCPGGPPELLHYGERGILVPIDDPAEMAKGLVCALSQPRGLHTAAVRSEYSVERSADEYLNVAFSQVPEPAPAGQEAAPIAESLDIQMRR